MNISVIVCTYNRCESLRSALNSVANSKLSDDVTWEVLVVDNNSSDQTGEVAKEFCRQYPNRFRYLFERQQGKSYALNSGIREARGDILAFMDDDVTVETSWLQHLTAPLADGDWVGSGGRILPERTFSLPHWLSSEGPCALAPLAVFDLGSDSFDLAEPPFGTNMAFRKKVFERYGGFRTDLGPSPGSEIRSEDTEFGRRVLSGGGRLRYEPLAVVYHPAPASRLKREYFLAWWFDKARADVREFGIDPGARWSIGGIPLCLFRKFILWTARWMITFHVSRRFDCKRRVWSVVGSIVEHRRMARRQGTLTKNTGSNGELVRSPNDKM